MAFKKSILSRSFELAKMSINIGVKELKSGSLHSRIEQAKVLAQSLTQLRGAAMKAGQLISIEMADYFPPEAAEVLAQMQNQATSSSYEVIQKILIQELGSKKFNSITKIDQKAVASASIAQIHRAVWENQNIALKIQHEGVIQSIDSDLSIIKKLSETFCKLTQREIDLTPLFNELKEVLIQETDFLQEAHFLNEYKNKIASMDEKYKIFYSTPSVISELTTKRVLAMSWEEGETITHWMRTLPSMNDRNDLAHLILNLYCHEFFVWGLVQTDPNFSNFLIRKTDNNLKLVLLDFGSTRHYDNIMVNQYIELMRSVQSRNSAKIISEAIDFGMINEKESTAAKELFVKMMFLAIEPFETNGEFDFANSDYAKRSQGVIFEFVKSLKYSPPPHRIIFLHRKLAGIFSLLKKLEIKLNITSYWDFMINK